VRLILGLLLFPVSGWAFEAYPLMYETIRTRGMGGAMTAVGDDEQTLYANPAALGARERKAYAILDLAAEYNSDAKKVKDETDRLLSADTPESRSFNNNVLSRVMGKRSRAQVSNLGYYLGKDGFGAGILYQNLVEVGAIRPTNPKVQSLVVSDTVLSGSFARPVGGINTAFSDKAKGWWGGSVKVFTRSYARREFDARDFATLSESALFNNRYNGVTGDLDFSTFWKLENPWNQTVGLTVGNLLHNQIDPNIGELRPWVSVGTAIRPLSGPPERRKKLLLAADLWDVSRDVSVGSKVRLGIEAIPRPWLILRGGLRGGYLTGGFTTSFRLIQFDFATYSEELGSRPGNHEDRRYSASLSAVF
jgi:hypothetical protein